MGKSRNSVFLLRADGRFRPVSGQPLGLAPRMMAYQRVPDIDSLGAAGILYAGSRS